jgi:hypothetical protein
MRNAEIVAFSRRLEVISIAHSCREKLFFTREDLYRNAAAMLPPSTVVTSPVVFNSSA